MWVYFLTGGPLRLNCDREASAQAGGSIVFMSHDRLRSRENNIGDRGWNKRGFNENEL